MRPLFILVSVSALLSCSAPDSVVNPPNLDEVSSELFAGGDVVLTVTCKTFHMDVTGVTVRVLFENGVGGLATCWNPYRDPSRQRVSTVIEGAAGAWNLGATVLEKFDYQSYCSWDGVDLPERKLSCTFLTGEPGGPEACEHLRDMNIRGAEAYCRSGADITLEAVKK